jgi:hypothetical protein
MIRKDLPDVIYKTKNAKYRAVVREVKKRHATGQPDPGWHDEHQPVGNPEPASG